MRSRAWLSGLVLILVALTLTLTALAYASPPDPTWIPGLYDDDDFDNVVDFITSSSGFVDVPIITDLRPVEDLLALQIHPADDIVACIPHSAFGPRAPPTV
jgi:hypothetical protein